MNCKPSAAAKGIAAPFQYNWWMWVCQINECSLSVGGRRVAIAFIVFLIFAAASEGSVVHLTGAIRYQNLGPDGKIGAELKANFEVNLSSNLWMIRIVPKEFPVTNLLATECWFDGSSIYYLRRWATNSGPALKSEARSLGFASVTLQVNSGNVPPFDSSLCFPAWLASASADYFHKHDLIGPILQMGNGVDSFTEEPRLTRVIGQYRSVESSQIPESLQFFNVGKYAEVLPDSTNLVAYRPPFDKGFLEGEYKVLVWNTNDAIEFPAESELTLYSPLWPKSEKPPTEIVIVPLVRIHLSWQQAEINDKEVAFLPVFSEGQLTRVADYRTKIEGKALVYFTTNGLARPGSNFDAMVERFTRFEKREEERIGSHLRPARFGTRVLILAACGVSSLFLWYLFRQQKNNPVN
jgi:hypothetical protein